MKPLGKRPPKAPRPTRADLSERSETIAALLMGQRVTKAQKRRVRQIERKIDAYEAWRFWPGLRVLERAAERAERLAERIAALRSTLGLP